MEVKIQGNTKPNKPISFFGRVRTAAVKAFKTAAAFFERAAKKFTERLRSVKLLNDFICVTAPARCKKAAQYIKRHYKRVIVLVSAAAAAFSIFLILTRKDTVNSDYHADGNEEAEFAMVLQNYSTFDHIEKTHIAVRLSWDDGAVDLNGGIAKAKIKAKVFPVNLPDDTISWNTSDWDIATIDSDGNITATNPGRVKIYAVLKSENKIAEASLEVRQPVSGIFLPTSTVTMYTGGAGKHLEAKIFPENASDKNVVWKSKNSKIARVDSRGNVLPVSAGMTEITAVTEDGGFEGKCFVTVVNPSVDVESLTVVNASDMTVKAGESLNAVVTVSPSNARNKTLRWSSDNESVALVSQLGRIRGVAEGTANITVESVNGKKQTFSVAVTEGGRDPFDMDTSESVSGGVTYTSYDITFPQAVRIQAAQNPPLKIWTYSGTVYATETEIAEYMNPNNYYTDAYKYQFLDLSRPNNVSAERLNAYLEDKGVLRGMGEVFAEAAKEYNVSEVYLIAHACLESGNGTSQLATGVDVNGTAVYNVYGINAYDSNPLGGGSSKAYAEGWTSVEKAITGGAEWISRYYINNPEGRQNTLYKMLWNPENPTYHQYATDIGWAIKQAVSIEKIFASFDGAQLSFDIPVYSGQIPPVVTARQ